MRDADNNQTDADLQAMLRAEIIDLRAELAKREAEILALLDQKDSQAIEHVAEGEIRENLTGGIRARLLRLRHWVRLRHHARALSASPLFDADWYAQNNPDCGGPSNAIRHYLLTGAFNGRDPGPDFDQDAYYRANPDVAAAGWPALVHYVLHGSSEGRRLHPLTGGDRDAPV